MTEPIHDLAHIGHAELLTPFPDDSLRFFVNLFGMEVEARSDRSVYLRGWGDYQRYSLKLTESDLPGLGHMAIRAWSPEGVQRRVAAIERSGLGLGWIDGDLGHGPAYRFTDPDGHCMELYYESERSAPPPQLRPALKNVPQRYVGRGAAVKRLDHVNLLAADVTVNRRCAQEQLGFRLYEQIVGDDGVETGAWMSLTIAAHRWTPSPSSDSVPGAESTGLRDLPHPLHPTGTSGLQVGGFALHRTSHAPTLTGAARGARIGC